MLASLSFEKMRSDLQRNIVRIDFDSMRSSLARLKYELNIIHVMRAMGWTKGIGQKRYGGLDEYVYVCLDILTDRLPFWGGKDLAWRLIEDGEEELTLVPDFLGPNGWIPDDFYELDLEDFTDDFSLIAYLLINKFGDYGIDKQEFIKRFNWPEWDLINIEADGYLDEKYLEKYLSREMMTAVRMTLLETRNIFLDPTPEDDFHLDLTVENIRLMVRDLKEAQKLDKECHIAMQHVAKQPALLVGLAYMLRKSMKK